MQGVAGLSSASVVAQLGACVNAVVARLDLHRYARDGPKNCAGKVGLLACCKTLDIQQKQALFAAAAVAHAYRYSDARFARSLAARFRWTIHI